MRRLSGSSGRRAIVVLVVAAAYALAVAPGTAGARDGKDGREVLVAGICGAGATAKLRLKADDGGIELEFEVDHARVGVLWRVVVVHERRVVWKGLARTNRRGGSFEVKRTLRDLPGPDAVTVRAWGPRGLTCRATATLAGS